MLQIIQVVGKLLFRLCDSGPVMRIAIVADLRPSGKAGSYEIARIVVRNSRVVFGRQFRQLRSRSHERKIAADDVPKLGEFVEPQKTKPSPRARDTELGLPALAISTLVVAAHAPEFYDTYRLLESADSMLGDENIAAVVELYREHNERIENERDY